MAFGEEEVRWEEEAIEGVEVVFEEDGEDGVA